MFMGAGRAESTADIVIPTDPFERVIGQEQAVAIARLAPSQRRHLLLVGPPGTGKSLIARAVASLLPRPKFEVSVIDNTERPERPIVEIRDKERIEKEAGDKTIGTLIAEKDVPVFIAERFGLRCRRCGLLVRDIGNACDSCGAFSLRSDLETRIASTAKNSSGKQYTVVYKMTDSGKVLALSADDLKKEEEVIRRSKRKVILSMNRNTFIQVSGASETELLGDVAHDPYGGHKELGAPPFMRVIPGAVHEAHEGVLFIDELSTLGNIQRHLLTAMQEKSFPITGRNPSSSGASVRVDAVPCDFIMVGATNINDLPTLLPALRSRINGDGYEILMNSTMPDSAENRKKLGQFVAQEIVRDGRIPHAGFDAIESIINHAKKIARDVDGESASLTLRLRNLSGVIKLAGDMAAVSKNELISKEDVLNAIVNARSIEEKLKDRYGSSWKAGAADFSVNKNKPGRETG